MPHAACSGYNNKHWDEKSRRLPYKSDLYMEVIVSIVLYLWLLSLVQATVWLSTSPTTVNSPTRGSPLAVVAVKMSLT